METKPLIYILLTDEQVDLLASGGTVKVDAEPPNPGDPGVVVLIASPCVQRDAEAWHAEHADEHPDAERGGCACCCLYCEQHNPDLPEAD